MKIETLQDRIAKAEEKVAKKTATIEKKKKSIEKKAKMLMTKYGVDANTFDKYNKEERDKFGREEGNEIYWTMCDIDWYKDDIDRITKEIPEIQKTIEKYKAQLAGEIEKESLFIREIPETMKRMQDELVTEWDRWDKERQERLQKIYDEVGYDGFFHGTEEYHYCNRHTYADYEFMHETYEHIHESNMRDAKIEILNLYNRVKDITGEVTDWSGIKLEQGNTFPVLTGIVTGKEGKANVETILAGGYNIQRLHVRTLVHSF